MMLGIQIGNEFLDLPPGSTMEIEQMNPFLQLSQEVTGGYSLPLTIQATGKNMRMLQYAGISQKRVSGLGLNAIAWDFPEQHSRGRIKIEKPQLHINRSEESHINIYYLFGEGDFNQDINNVNLRAVNLGGNRTFSWDNYVRNGAGFWGHIHKVIDAAAGYGTSGYDYAFFPVINKSWQGYRTSTEIMNHVTWNSPNVDFSQKTTDNKDANVIIPFPYLKYVLQKSVEHVGWTITGGILEDSNFKKITLINFQSIDWAQLKRVVSVYTVVPKSSISFNLVDHLPDITIGQFLIALKNRFGWWYEFDKSNKTIRIRQLSAATTAATKDYTRYTDPRLIKTINNEKKIYALRNDFVTDLGDGAPDLGATLYQGTINRVVDLPTAAEARDSHVYLVISENSYYICRQNDTTENYEWVFFAYNIYDYDPGGTNDEVITSATTVGMETYNSYYDIIPRIDNPGEWLGRTDTPSSWGLHLCFYHGLKNNRSSQLVPYGSSHIYDANFNQVADWGLSFQCPKVGGDDVGLVETFWKKFLESLLAEEELEITLNLPRHLYMTLRPTDRIIIDSVLMYIKKVNATLPYNGSVRLECLRI